MAREFGIPKADIEIRDELYEASTETWLQAIAALPAKAACVMMVGHNPELTALANRLLPRARIDNVPTCGVLCLDYAIRDWAGIARAKPAHWHFDYPKNG